MADPKAPATPNEAVDAILADEQVVWFPVKHYSMACAWHVRRIIAERRPAAVLVEGPDDATALIEYVVAADTTPPLTLLSSYVDRKNRFGLNGVLSPSETVPARYRAWWPLVSYAPELAALKAGAEVGAELAFVDAPLPATIPHQHVPRRRAVQVVSDRHLAENAYFDGLARRQRRRSFEEFWHANFEAGGVGATTDAFMRAVLTFAWCARHVTGGDPEAARASLEADGTLLRESHMKWHVARAKKAHPDGTIVVVTGAFHSVALPFRECRKKRAKAKADRDTETVLTAHSYRALANLYEMNRLPEYGERVWQAMQAEAERPFDAAAMELLVEIQRTAREDGLAVSTADSVGAWAAAQNLASLRDNREVTLDDLVDAAHMAYVKGDARLGRAPVDAALRRVLVGRRLGRVTEEAGQVPLMRSFYAGCRSHRLDVSGEEKVVRCDLHKHDKHQLKSAFLHRCDFLEIPMFAYLDSGRGWRRAQPRTRPHFKGPDLATGEDMHLITETWGVRWTEEVDDRLLELAHLGATIAEAASARVREVLEDARGSASATTRLLLRSAQMMATDVFDEVLRAVEDAIDHDAEFGSLVESLASFVMLHSYRNAVATRGVERLLRTIEAVYTKACLVLPGIAHASEERTAEVLEHVQTLVRTAITFEATRLDHRLLIEKVREMVRDLDGEATLRGAGFGVLFAFGSTREKVVAAELDGYALGSPERVLEAGPFLDGLLTTSKSIFMGSRRLLRAIDRVVGQLDWETFKLLLPDLRRAFTQFIPSEIDEISRRVSEEIGLEPPPDPDAPIPEDVATLGAEADARVAALLDAWRA